MRSGLKGPTDQKIELRDELLVETQAVALIGHGRIGEAVRDHPLAFRQGRTHPRLQVLTARGEVQQRLGHRLPAPGLAGNQELADLLGARAAARLPGLDHLKAEVSQGFGEQADLGRLAGPFPAFEGDEFSFGGRCGHVQILPFRPAAGSIVSGHPGSGGSNL